MATARRKAAPPKESATPKQPRKGAKRAGIAQSVEQVPSKHKVAGSSPAPRSKRPTPGATVQKLITAKGAADPDRILTPEMEAFITEYLRNGRNGTAAYLSVYPKNAPATAAVSAHHVLRRPNVAARISAEVNRLAQAHVMTREHLMADLVAIVRADPGELMQMRHIACEECWPKTDGPMGNWTDPNPDCIPCAGQGVLKPWFADTRTLSPGARMLFAGVKVTKDGVQILTESKDAARDKLAKILGAYEKDNEQKQPLLAEQLAEFLGGLHAAGAGKLPISPRTQKP